MPQILVMSDVMDSPVRAKKTGMLAPKTPAPRTAPLKSLRTDVKISNVRQSQVKKFIQTIRSAKIHKAVSGIRLSLIALANGRFEEAGRIAINSAIEATAAYRQDADMATRVVATARGVIDKAIRGIMARSV